MELALPRLAADGRLIAALTVGLRKKAQEDGYRVRYRPVAKTNFEEFPTLTTPAAAFVPEASLCIFAVDPKSGLSVSDTYFGDMESLARDPTPKVDLTFTTKPASNPRCEK